MGSLRGYS